MCVVNNEGRQSRKKKMNYNIFASQDRSPAQMKRKSSSLKAEHARQSMGHHGSALGQMKGFGGPNNHLVNPDSFK